MGAVQCVLRHSYICKGEVVSVAEAQDKTVCVHMMYKAWKAAPDGAAGRPCGGWKRGKAVWTMCSIRAAVDGHLHIYI